MAMTMDELVTGTAAGRREIKAALDELEYVMHRAALRDLAIGATMAESGFGIEVAEGIAELLQSVAIECGDGKDDDCLFLNLLELEVLHPALVLIMPDEVSTPRPGSAHDLWNRAFLTPNCSFVHTIDGDEIKWCAVAIAVDRTART